MRCTTSEVTERADARSCLATFCQDKDMETRIIGFGRMGRFHIEPRTVFLRWELSLEPWSGMYYAFHGCGLPLLMEKVVGEYRGHRARVLIWDGRMASFWEKTHPLWMPVLDWTHEQDFANYIGFRYHPCRIEWYWNMQYGDSREVNRLRIEGLKERFETLGSQLRKTIAAEHAGGTLRR